MAIIASALSGCATIQRGPLESPDFPSIARTQILKDGDTVRFTRPASWYPGAHGFTYQIGDVGLHGVLAIGDKALGFAVWNENTARYDRALYVQRSAINAAEVHKFGLGRALVVKTEDSFYSFSISSIDSVFNDADATEAAAKQLTP